MYFRDGRRLTDFPLCQGVPVELFERSIEKVHYGLHVLAARIAYYGVRAVLYCRILGFVFSCLLWNMEDRQRELHI